MDHPILGTNFFFFNLNVDVRTRQLIDKTRTLMVNGVGPHSGSLQIRALLSCGLGSNLRISSHGNCKISRFCATPSTFWRASECCNTWVLVRVGTKRHSSIIKQVSIASLHGAKARSWRLATLRGLSSLKFQHTTGPMSFASYAGLH